MESDPELNYFSVKLIEAARESREDSQTAEINTIPPISDDQADKSDNIQFENTQNLEGQNQTSQSSSMEKLPTNITLLDDKLENIVIAEQLPTEVLDPTLEAVVPPAVSDTEAVRQVSSIEISKQMEVAVEVEHSQSTISLDVVDGSNKLSEENSEQMEESSEVGEEHPAMDHSKIEVTNNEFDHDIEPEEVPQTIAAPRQQYDIPDNFKEIPYLPIATNETEVVLENQENFADKPLEYVTEVSTFGSDKVEEFQIISHSEIKSVNELMEESEYTHDHHERTISDELQQVPESMKRMESEGSAIEVASSSGESLDGNDEDDKSDNQTENLQMYSTTQPKLSASLTTLESIDVSSSSIDASETSTLDSEFKRFSCYVDDEVHSEVETSKSSRQFEVTKEVIVTEMKRSVLGLLTFGNLY